MKFDDIYNEALVNMATPTQNPAAPATGTTPATAQKPKIDPARLGVIAQKWNKAKTANQPLNLTPQEMEALDQLLGGNLNQQPQQTNTPPVVQNPQPSNKPQVTTTPAI
jgi:hypothetical protein